MSTNFKRFSICVDDDTYEKLIKIKQTTGNSLADISRGFIKKGLAQSYVDESEEIIASIVRQQLEIVLKPHIERLAALSSKSGHMSASAAFLNVQALMDLVPTERRKDVVGMFNSARKKAIAYMRTKVNDEGGLDVE